jgi:uncharacterized protein (DUF1697 family)
MMHIALLRAINVGGRNLVAMSELRGLLGELGFGAVQSLLQSGNLVFQGDGRTCAALERLLEVETEKRFGIAVDYMIRGGRDWETIIAKNPFSKEAKSDPGHLIVMFLKAAPEAKCLKALEAVIRGPEIVRSVGTQLYMVYPLGMGKSKLTTALIERKLVTRGTCRNWNTVLKLAALVEA